MRCCITRNFRVLPLVNQSVVLASVPPNMPGCGVTSMPEELERKLAAILAADIAGYSALMGADEEATVRDLKAHQAVILPMIAMHGGRIIDTAGDGILAEFPSVVNAVECAVALQKVMAERNGSIPLETSD